MPLVTTSNVPSVVTFILLSGDLFRILQVLSINESNIPTYTVKMRLLIEFLDLSIFAQLPTKVRET